MAFPGIKIEVTNGNLQQAIGVSDGTRDRTKRLHRSERALYMGADKGVLSRTRRQQAALCVRYCRDGYDGRRA